VEHKYGKTLDQLRPNFAWASTDRVKATLEASTQFFRATQWSKKIKQHFKSRFPGANMEQINEVVSTDTAYINIDRRSDGISGHGGACGFQLFAGNESRHLAVYPVQTDGAFPAVLDEWWPLCVEYIAMVKNHMARSSLKNRTPIEVRTGQTPDVLKLLQYHWWEPVYFLDEEGTECLGRWAGVAKHVGDELTFIVVSDKTGHAMFRSDLRTVTDPNAPNFQAKTIAADHLASSGAQDPGSVFSPIGQLPEVGEVKRVYPYALDDLVGKTFMCEELAILSDMRLCKC
jgi:hypothetical protein